MRAKQLWCTKGKSSKLQVSLLMKQPIVQMIISERYGRKCTSVKSTEYLRILIIWELRLLLKHTPLLC